MTDEERKADEEFKAMLQAFAEKHRVGAREMGSLLNYGPGMLHRWTTGVSAPHSLLRGRIVERLEATASSPEGLAELDRLRALFEGNPYVPVRISGGGW